MIAEKHFEVLHVDNVTIHYESGDTRNAIIASSPYFEIIVPYNKCDYPNEEDLIYEVYLYSFDIQDALKRNYEFVLDGDSRYYYFDGEIIKLLPFNPERLMYNLTGQTYETVEIEYIYDTIKFITADGTRYNYNATMKAVREGDLEVYNLETVD